MNILYLASEKSLTLNQSGGAGTHIRGTLSYLNKYHEIKSFIGGDILNQIDFVQNQERKIKKGSPTLKWVKKLIPRQVRLIKQDLNRIKFCKLFYSKVLEFLDQDIHFKADLIYERSGYGSNAGIKLSNHLGIPLIIESDVLICDFYKNYSSIIFNKLFFKNLEKQKLQSASKVVVMSQGSIKKINQIWGISKDKVCVKGLGIEPSNSDFNEVLPLKTKLKLTNKFVVGFTGIFQPYHNVDVLVEAEKHLSKESDILIMVIGIDAAGKDYTKVVQGQNKIHFTGLIDHKEIPAYYNRFDVGIIPGSADFMYPVKFLEFGLYNKPCLVPRHEAYREFFLDDKEFEMFSFVPHASIDMAEKILFFRENFDELKERWKRVHKLIIDNYSWDMCARRLNDVFIEFA